MEHNLIKSSSPLSPVLILSGCSRRYLLRAKNALSYLLDQPPKSLTLAISSLLLDELFDTDKHLLERLRDMLSRESACELLAMPYYEPSIRASFLVEGIERGRKHTELLLGKSPSGILLTHALIQTEKQSWPKLAVYSLADLSEKLVRLSFTPPALQLEASEQLSVCLFLDSSESNDVGDSECSVTQWLESLAEVPNTLIALSAVNDWNLCQLSLEEVCFHPRSLGLSHEARREQLHQEFQDVESEIPNLPQQDANQVRIKDAANWLVRMAYQSPQCGALDVREDNIRFEDFAMLQCQVLLDKIRHPETDPAEGWLSAHSLERSSGVLGNLYIDTPFLRMYLQHAAVLRLEYKPRKLTLLTTPGFLASSDSCNLLHPPARVLRANPNFASVRLEEHFKARGFSLIKNLSVRGGVGAHLPNATTGFDIEYWVEPEGNPEPPEIIELLVPFQLPQMHLGSARPLLAVGGNHDRTLSLSKPFTLTQAEIQSSLHGVRLIDGSTNFVLDFRSAKPLNYVRVGNLADEVSLPSPANSVTKVGIPIEDIASEEITKEMLIIRFGIESKRIFGDTKPNTIFVSIA